MGLRKNQVKISATLKGILSARDDGTIIEAPYCRYPVRGMIWAGILTTRLKYADCWLARQGAV